MPLVELTRYACANVSFEACEESLETLIVALRAPGPPGSLAPSVTLSREPMLARDTLRMHADRKVLELKTEAPEMELLPSRAFAVQRRAAIELRFRWATSRAVIDQTMVLIDAGGETARRVTLMNLTSSVDDADASRAIFWEILQTVRFGEETTPLLPFPSPPPEPPQEAPRLPFIPMPGHDRRCDRT